MYAIIYNDAGKDLTLAHTRTIEQANELISKPQKMFNIPLQKDMLNQYRKQSLIKDLQTGFIFYPLCNFS